MGVRKALGILAFSTQAVIAVDYNMQSQKAGLQPGELSMSEYAAIVQKRYEAPKSIQFVAEETRTTGLWGKLSGVGSQVGSGVGTGGGTGLAARATGREDLAKAEITPGSEAPAPVCIRRGTALDCN